MVGVSDPEFHAITITWDLEDGTGISVRYGEMEPERAAHLMQLSAQLVMEHAHLLQDLDFEDYTEEFVEDEEEWDEEEEDE